MPTVLHTFLSLSLFLGMLIVPFPDDALPHPILERYDPIEGKASYRWGTQLYFNENKEIVVDLKNSRILYREKGSRKFISSNLQLLRPHSIVFNPSDKMYYMADTDNHRIIAFDSLENPRIRSSTSEVDGIALNRPHDIVYDTESGWLYSINPLAPVIFRFKGIGEEESSLDLSNLLDYSRSLTFSNGRLYVVGSANGTVVEIVDFENAIFHVYRSPGKIHIAPEGNWQQTGLILNDVEYYNDYWYASSYFYPSMFWQGTDYNKYKLIRFRTWQQFEDGEWEDLSHSLPEDLVPYYLTVHEDQLFVPLYNHREPGVGDCIYRITVK